jgi:hypothetical protein
MGNSKDIKENLYIAGRSSGKMSKLIETMINKPELTEADKFYLSILSYRADQRKKGNDIGYEDFYPNNNIAIAVISMCSERFRIMNIEKHPTRFLRHGSTVKIRIYYNQEL